MRIQCGCAARRCGASLQPHIHLPYQDVILDCFHAADLADQFSRPISFGTCLDEPAELHDAFEGFDIDGQAADQRVVEKHCFDLGAERTVV